MMVNSDNKKSHVVIRQNEELNLLEGVDFVSSTKCGAINTFSGTIRDTDIKSTKSGTYLPIVALHYEAYESMAIRQIYEILRETMRLLNATNDGVDMNSKAYVGLRLGRVPVGEASLVICVSSTGRLQSHKATLMILERIKSSVAIWKKIIFSDGTEEWADDSKSEAIWLKEEQ